MCKQRQGAVSFRSARGNQSCQKTVLALLSSRRKSWYLKQSRGVRSSSDQFLMMSEAIGHVLSVCDKSIWQYSLKILTRQIEIFTKPFFVRQYSHLESYGVAKTHSLPIRFEAPRIVGCISRTESASTPMVELMTMRMRSVFWNVSFVHTLLAPAVVRCLLYRLCLKS